MIFRGGREPGAVWKGDPGASGKNCKQNNLYLYLTGQRETHRPRKNNVMECRTPLMADLVGVVGTQEKARV